DINPALEPDIVSSIDELKERLDRNFDLVVCCEVLEHMPLEMLDDNIKHLKSFGDRLFLSLPNSYKSFGVSGLLRFPKLGVREFDLNFDFPFKHKIAGTPHFWEVGYDSFCTKKAIVSKLKMHYSSVSVQR